MVQGKTRRWHRLSFKFIVIFTLFTIITLLLCGVSTYYIQLNRHEQEIMHSAFDIAKSLESDMLVDGDVFREYQEYILENSDDIFIPYDFTEYRTAHDDFYRAFAKKYPGAIYGYDVTFSDLSKKLKKKYIIYYLEYMTLAYEEARQAYGVPYTYYAVPTGDGLHIKYPIDMQRYKKVFPDGREGLEICDDVEESKTIYSVMWKTWDTGEIQESYDNFGNDHGNTNSYYVPLKVDGKTIGLVCVDIDARAAKQEIAINTGKQMAGVGMVLIFAVMITIYYIQLKYISKLTRLENYVVNYAYHKDTAFLENLLKDANGRDEISLLAGQLANMIATLDDFSRHIESVSDELSDTRTRAGELHELATTDPLTGLNNKTAYDAAVARLNQEVEKGTARFAIVMADLNFLKKINDTYGHEYGNIAIQTLGRRIQSVFTYSAAYRIGGDEFVIILEGNQVMVAQPLVDQLLLEVQRDTSETDWEHISVALGLARFGEVPNDSVDATFKRADIAMYEHKKAMKAERRD